MILELNKVAIGSFFKYEGGMYCKGGSGKGDERLCHPVTQGRYGPTIQDELEVWLPASAQVLLVAN